MTKRLLLLNGLAIMAVVCNHASHWGFISLSWCLGQTVAAGDNTQIGALTYYGLVAIGKLAVFSVPAFLVVSGFFVAYAARGSQSALGWKMVTTRVTSLAVHYIIWSVVIFVTDAFQGIRLPPDKYLLRLAYG